MPETCRAVGAKSKGLKMEDISIELEPLGNDDIEIVPLFNGVCHSDIHLLEEDLGPCPFPKAPGHEIVGKVVKKGSSVNHLKEGDLVGVGWFKNCCLECDACVRGEDNYCPQVVPTIMGSSNGGFAERFRCFSALAVKLPGNVEPQYLAPLMCAGITVWSPISRYVTRPGMKVGVAGIGGLGHLALQFARAQGCEVYALSGNKGKEAEAQQLGAHHFVKLDDVPDATLDLLLNTAPEGVHAAQALPKLTAHGTLVFLGGLTQTLDGNVADLVLQQRSITGSAVGGRAGFREMLRVVALHNIKPMIEVMPLAEATQAFKKLKDGPSPKYRVVLETGDYFSKK